MLNKILIFQLLAATALFCAQPLTQTVKKHVLDVAIPLKVIQKIITDYIGNEIEAVPYKTITANTTYIHSLACSPDGKYIATGSSASQFGKIELWDAVSGNLLYWIAPQGTPAPQQRSNMEVFLDKVFAIGSYPEEFRDTTVLQFSPDSTQIATIIPPGVGFKKFSIATKEWKQECFNKSKVFQFSPDGTYIATFDGRTVLIGPHTDNNIFKNTFFYYPVTMTTPQAQLSFNMTYSSNGRVALLVFNNSLRNCSLLIFNTVNRTCERVIQSDAKRHPIHDISYSPNGKYLAAAWTTLCGMALMNTTDYDTEKTFLTDANNGETIKKLSFSADGNYIATIDSYYDHLNFTDPNNKIKTGISIWNVNTQQRLLKLRNFTTPEQLIGHLSFSPDGKQLIFSVGNKIEILKLIYPVLEWEENVPVAQAATQNKTEQAQEATTQDLLHATAAQQMLKRKSNKTVLSD